VAIYKRKIGPFIWIIKKGGTKYTVSLMLEVDGIVMAKRLYRKLLKGGRCIVEGIIHNGKNSS